jgi:hypothetical protein
LLHKALSFGDFTLVQGPFIGFSVGKRALAGLYRQRVAGISQEAKHLGTDCIEINEKCRESLTSIGQLRWRSLVVVVPRER